MGKCQAHVLKLLTFVIKDLGPLCLQLRFSGMWKSHMALKCNGRPIYYCYFYFFISTRQSKRERERELRADLCFRIDSVIEAEMFQEPF